MARVQVRADDEMEDDFAPSDDEGSDEEDRYKFKEHFEAQVFVDEDGTEVPLTIYGQVYVQEGSLGFVSFHFEEAGSYVSYESLRCCDLRTLDNGSKPPARKPFVVSSYEPLTRTFWGEVDWAPTTWDGAERWVYEMIFSKEFTCIESGKVEKFRPSMVVPFDVAVFGRDLFYLRWLPPASKPREPDLPVSQWEERLIPVDRLRYSQDSCRWTFSDGRPILTMFNAIKDGTLDPEEMEYLVVEKHLKYSDGKGLFVAEGHRRLWVLKTLQSMQAHRCIQVRVRIIPEVHLEAIKRMSQEEWTRAGLSAKEVRQLRDFHKLTFTTKNDGTEIVIRVAAEGNARKWSGPKRGRHW